MRQSSILSFFALVLLFFALGCSDLTEIDSVDVDPNGEYAIPLINTSATILDIAENTSSNASVRVDPDGKLTVLYSAEPVSRTARDIFAPYEISIPLSVDSTTFPLPLPIENFPDQWVLNKAKLSDVSIKWSMRSGYNEDVTVDIEIPELSNNGVGYKRLFTIPSNVENYITEWDDLDGWDVLLTNNEMIVNYVATRPNGDTIELENLVFQFSRLDFGYIEGFFGREVNLIEGNVITVGAFSNWLSGGLWFENPKVNIVVENSFGFPVKAEFNEVRFTTVTNNIEYMTGDFITDGVEFEYPSLSEVGVVKENEFTFDSTNSNIQVIFNEKVKEVYFNINAIGNPDDDASIIGFMTSDSYYEVTTDVEMPLFMRANDLVLTDTFDLDFEGYEDIASGEFKLVMENEFPFDYDIQMYFRKNGITTDSLFEQSYFLSTAEVDSDGNTTSAGEQTAFITFDQERITRATEADDIVFIIKVASFDDSGNSFWIYDDYKLDLRLGAKLKFTNI